MNQVRSGEGDLTRPEATWAGGQTRHFVCSTFQIHGDVGLVNDIDVAEK